MESNLKQYIEELISEIQNELDEATATGNVAGYNTPNAFSDKGTSDKNRKKKMAKRIGYTLAGKIDESFMSDLDLIKKGSKDITDFIKKVLSNKDYKEVRTDKEFHKYLKSFYNESVVAEGPMDRIFGGIPYTKKGKQSIVTMKLPDDVKERIIQRAKKEGKVAKPNFGGGVTVFESVIDEVIDKDDLKTAKELLKYPHTIEDIEYRKTSRGDKFVKIIYKKKYVPGKMMDTGPHFVSVFYTDEKDLQNIGKALKLKLKESVNEAKIKRPVNRWLELKNDETMHPHKKMAHGLKELKYQLAETEKFFKWYNKIKNINELESSNYWKRTQNHIYKIKERLVNIARTIQEIEK